MVEAYQKAEPSLAFERIHNRFKKRQSIRRLQYTVAAACILICLSFAMTLLFQKEDLNSEINAVNYPRTEKHVLFTSSDGKSEHLKNGGELISLKNGANSSVTNTLVTEPGGNFKLVLPDQSVVYMNANTTIRYAADFLKDRTVILEGEAFFEVTKNGSPFFVKSKENTVRVLGTHFNISAYPRRPITTTLVEGTVEVSNNIHKRILAPQQQAKLISPESEFEVQNVNTSIYTSWIKGVFEFQHTPLQEIMEQLKQWYDLEIIYQTPRLKEIRFTGSLFRENSLEYSLQIIEGISNVKFRDKNGRLYVYK